VDVTMPQLGETVTEGTITRWFKQPGDAVAADEPLFEVSTDKVDSEVPAPSSGTLREILVPEGETVDVGTRLAVLDGEDDGGAAGQSGGETASPAATEAPAQEGEPSREETSAAQPPDSPPAPEPSTPPPGAGTEPEGSPPEPSPTTPSAPAPAPASETRPATRDTSRSAPASTDDGGGAVTSPLVRRLINEHGLDRAQIRASGEGGRITRRDVLVAADQARARGAPGGTEDRLAVAEQPSGPVARPRQDDERIPFDNMRRRTAEHMVRSKSTSAHVYTSVEVDFERVERVRGAHQEEWRASEGYTLTYLPFISRAVCDTIVEYPRVNASIDGDSLVVHHAVHLGIAVDLDFQGLIAPVIRDADGKRLWLLAREVRELAQRARSKQLSPDDVLGGTFTITNPGPYGSYMTLPIINQPQVAILSTDGIAKRPVVVEGPDGEDAIAAHHTGLLTLTWDHRAFDGAYASAFLRSVKEILEHRDWNPELA